MGNEGRLCRRFVCWRWLLEMVVDCLVKICTPLYSISISLSLFAGEVLETMLTMLCHLQCVHILAMLLATTGTRSCVDLVVFAMNTIII